VEPSRINQPIIWNDHTSKPRLLDNFFVKFTGKDWWILQGRMNKLGKDSNVCTKAHFSFLIMKFLMDNWEETEESVNAT